jgi:hypothetical protein
MELTKKQRNNIYKGLLNLYLNEDYTFYVHDKNCYYYGFCYAVMSYREKMKHKMEYGIKNLTELLTICGKTKDSFIDRFWFDPHNKEKRIEILKQAIKETE